MYERLDHDIVMRYRSKVELKRELSLLGKSEGGEKSLICEQDLDSLCLFTRTEATTMELSKGTTCVDRYTVNKVSLNVLREQNPNSPPESDGDSNEISRSYKCMLGCDVQHKLIDYDVYMG